MQRGNHELRLVQALCQALSFPSGQHRPAQPRRARPQPSHPCDQCTLSLDRVNTAGLGAGQQRIKRHQGWISGGLKLWGDGVIKLGELRAGGKPHKGKRQTTNGDAMFHILFLHQCCFARKRGLLLNDCSLT